jgi:hypothetical protein
LIFESRSEQKSASRTEKLVAELVKLPPSPGAVDDLEEVRDALLKTAQIGSSVASSNQIYDQTYRPVGFGAALRSVVNIVAGTCREKPHLLEFYRDALIDEALAKSRCSWKAREGGRDSSKTIANAGSDAEQNPDPARLAYLFTRTKTPATAEIFRYLNRFRN